MWYSAHGYLLSDIDLALDDEAPVASITVTVQRHDSYVRAVNVCNLWADSDLTSNEPASDDLMARWLTDRNTPSRLDERKSIVIIAIHYSF